MSRDRYAASYSAQSGRSPIQRIVTLLLVILALALLVLARSHHSLPVSLRAGLLDFITPVTETLAEPVIGIRRLVRNKHALFDAFEENKLLRDENEKLRHWQEVAQALKAENDALRALAGYQPVTHASYITARVTGQSPSSYGATLTLNTGAGEGLLPLQPVVDAYGLIGRVTDLGEHYARVLLLSDSTSRVPVVTATQRFHAIASGTGKGDEMLRLTFLGGDPGDVPLGEHVVTTEEGGLIPGGIIVGTVFKRDANGLVVKPVRPLASSEYVRIIQAK